LKAAAIKQIVHLRLVRQYVSWWLSEQYESPQFVHIICLIPIIEKILIITTDGRTLVGSLIAFDNNTNLVLEDTIERIIRPADDPEPSSQVPHGLYLIRGDNVVICGLVDEELDASINWTKVRGEVIGGTKHV
jgi:U6 snRNA-associated Sm-like protein LSm8